MGLADELRAALQRRQAAEAMAGFSSPMNPPPQTSAPPPPDPMMGSSVEDKARAMAGLGPSPASVIMSIGRKEPEPPAGAPMAGAYQATNAIRQVEGKPPIAYSDFAKEQQARATAGKAKPAEEELPPWGGIQPGAASQQGYGGGQYVEGGWRNGARTIQHGVQLSPEAIEAMKGSDKSEDDALYWSKKANEQNSVVRGLQAQTEAEIREDHAHRRKQLYSDHQAKEQLARERIGDAQAAYDNQKIDPNRIFKDKPGMAVLAVLGGALGGALKGYNHLSNNGFLDNLNQTIQTDIDAQKSELEKKKHGVDLANNQYAMLRQKLGDDKAAEDQMFIDALDASSAKLKVMAEKANQPSVWAQEAEAQAKIMRARGERQASLDERMQDKIVEQQHYQQGGYVGGGVSPSKIKFDEERGVKGPDGNWYYAPTNKEGEAFRQLSSKLGEYKQNLAELAELRKHNGNFVSPAARARMNAIGAQIPLLEKDINTLGAITKTDTTLMPVPPEMATSLMPGTNARLEQAGKLADRSLNATFKNLPRVQHGWARDPKTGAPMRTGVYTTDIGPNAAQGNGAPATPQGFTAAGSKK